MPDILTFNQRVMGSSPIALTNENNGLPDVFGRAASPGKALLRDTTPLNGAVPRYKRMILHGELLVRGGSGPVPALHAAAPAERTGLRQ